MTKKPPQRTADDPAQSTRFIDAAHEAEADETEAAADSAFKKVTLQHPPKSKSRA